MAEKVQIVVEAVDKATAPLKNVSKSMGGLNTSAINMAAVLTVAKTAMSAVKSVLDQTVGAYISYANAMQDGSRLTGIAIEEYSRLVQVADDVRLSQEQLKTAFTIASRQGIDVSIEGLQKLSERYNALTDPTAKAQLLLKTFGRSGADMGRLMELGADGIREATGAIAENMVVTEESARKAENARLAMDNLDDTFTGLKYELAQGVIPALTDLLDLFSEGIAVVQKLKNWNNDLINVWKDHRDETEAAAESYDIFVDEMIRSGIEAGKFKGRMEDLAIQYRDGILWPEQYADAQKQLAEDLGLTEEGVFNLNRRMNDSPAAMARAGIAVKQLDDVVLPAAGSWQEYLDSVPEGDVFNGLITSAEDLAERLSAQMDLTLKLTDLTGDYTEKMAGLKDEHQALEDKLANLQLKFPWDKEGIAEAEQALIDNQTEIDNTALAYDQATKRIVWDMMVAKLAIDGYTQAEFDWAMQAGVDMGIITQESADLAVALMADAEKEIKAFEDAAAKADELGAAIQRLTSKEITITTYFRNVGSQGSGTGFVPDEIPQYYSRGADFVVPPGYPNDSYGPLYVESGERVVVVPKEERADNRTFNFNYSGNATRQSVFQAYEMARLLD